jgi:hypothetical protein
MSDRDSFDAAKIVAVAVSLLLAAFIIGFGYFQKSSNREAVEKGFDKTQGWIEEYHDRRNSDAGGIAITYGYKVGDHLFRREITGSAALSDCDGPMNDVCSHKRFWVIYSKEDPRKSLINLEMEIQDVSHPQFPETIEDFF